MGEANASGPAPAAGGKHEGSSVRLKRPELRQYSRFRMDEAIAQLYIKGFLSKIGLARKNEARSAVNLSEGGILMVTHAKLTPGTKVQVKIEIEKYHDLIEAEGEVRWCFQSARDASDFYAGIQFKNLPQAHAALIGKMRAWFTSPEFKQKTATRRRLAPPDLRK
jgi:hypothetical protein